MNISTAQKLTAYLNFHETIVEQAAALAGTTSTELDEKQFASILAILQWPARMIFVTGAPGSRKGYHAQLLSKMLGFVSPIAVPSPNPNAPKSETASFEHEAFARLLAQLLSPAYKKGAVVVNYPQNPIQAETIVAMAKNLPTTTQLDVVKIALTRPNSIMFQTMGRPEKAGARYDAYVAASRPAMEVLSQGLGHYPIIVSGDIRQQSNLPKRLQLTQSRINAALGIISHQ